jgi:hypothetical protein
MHGGVGGEGREADPIPIGHSETFRQGSNVTVGILTKIPDFAPLQPGGAFSFMDFPRAVG